MGKVLKVLFYIVLVAALVGGVILVRQTQENRGKATSSDNSLTVLPNGENYKKGDIIPMQINLYGGAPAADGTKYMVQSFAVYAKYDTTKLKYVEKSAKVEGIELVNDNTPLVMDTDACPQDSSGRFLCGGEAACPCKKIDQGGGTLLFVGLNTSTTNQGIDANNKSVKIISFSMEVLADSGSGTVEVDKEKSLIAVKQKGEENPEWKIGSVNNATYTVGGTMCDRCSVFYISQRAKWNAADCAAQIPKGTVINRYFDATCNNPSDIGNTQRTNIKVCQSCSNTENGKYLWWEVAKDLPCTASSLTSATVKFTADRESCRVVSAGFMCDRCSGMYDKQRVTYIGTDCSDMNVKAPQITRTYDENCSALAPSVATCNRCSKTVNGQYEWWNLEAGKVCTETVGVGVTVYKATKADCTVTSPECTSGEKRCVSASKKGLCVDGVWTEVNCDAGTSCTGNLGICMQGEEPPVCNSGEKKCVSTSKKALCTDGVWVETNCDTGTTCGGNTGLCVADSTNCTAGEKKCVSTTKKAVCTNGDWVETNCDTGTTCGGNTGLCVAVENTPIPTEPVSNSDLYLNFRTTMNGVLAANKCITGWNAKIVMKNSVGSTMIYTDVPMVRDGEIGTKAVFKVNLKLTGWTSKTDLLVFVKGPKHMQMKFGEDGQTGPYTAVVGKLIVSEGSTSPIYDFTGYSLMPGDVNLDGKISGGDFSQVKTKVSTHETFPDNTYRQEDLDGNCQFNGLDTSLLSSSLDTKQDEIY